MRLAMYERNPGPRAIPPAQVTKDWFERTTVDIGHKVNDDGGLGARSASTCRLARLGIYGRGGTCCSAHVLPSGSLKVTNDPHG